MAEDNPHARHNFLLLSLCSSWHQQVMVAFDRRKNNPHTTKHNFLLWPQCSSKHQQVMVAFGRGKVLPTQQDITFYCDLSVLASINK